MASFLVAEDHPIVGRCLARELEPYGECHVASSFAAGRALLESETWDAFVFDVNLGDGTGLDLLACARRRFPRTPAAVVTAELSKDAVNHATALDARIVGKPWTRLQFAPFLEAVIQSATADSVRAMVVRIRHTFGLSLRESEIVDACLRRLSPKDFVVAQGISLNTYKSQVRSLLRKTGARTLEELARDLTHAEGHVIARSTSTSRLDRVLG